MTGKERLTELVSRHIEGTGLFIVEISVSPSNNLRVLVDSEKGVTIGECAELSREMESRLNRDIEDFHLEVSSPGLSEPLKVIPQYVKNVGKDVEVVTLTGEKHTGKLIRIKDNGLVIGELIKTKGEKKRPEFKTEERDFDFDIIKSTKVIVSLK